MTMNKVFKAALKVTVAGLVIGGLMSSSLAYVKGKTYKYSVLHVNDTHGHFWEDERGQGGFAAVKTIVDQVRAEKDRAVIVLHGGDFNSGVPESDLLDAEPDLVGIKGIGFDVVAVGNHEFDVDLETMKKQRDFLAKAKIPLISANITYTDPKTGKTSDFYKPYASISRGGLNFLVVGATTPSSKYQANPVHTAPFTFNDPAESILKTVQKAKKDKVKSDVVIALNHLGLYYKGEYGDNPYGDYTLATMLPKGTLDLIVSSHTHVFGCVDEKGDGVNWKPGMVCNPPMPNGVPVVQARSWGMYVGRADYEFKDGVSKLVGYQLIPVNLKERIKNADGTSTYVDLGPQVKPDAKLYAELKKYQDKGQEALQVVVGKLSDELTTTRTQQTKLGWLVAEGQRVLTQSDVGIMNSGGIRAGLPKGDVTYKQVLIMQPFGNSLSSVELTGAELLDYVTKISGIEGGGFPQYAGITFDAKKVEGKFDDMKRQVMEVSNVKVNGQPLDLNKTYKLSVLTFLAEGGDRYPKISNKPSYVDTGYIDARAFADYITKLGEIDVSKITIEGANFIK